MPKVSVIIPTYNRSRYVTQAIDSILTQTYKDYEIVVVDDGSTDNTREVLEPYMDKIRYIYQENTGVSAARNLGIREAKGEWIAFLDSDDRWMPRKLERQMRLVNSNGVNVCFTNVIWQSESRARDINFHSTETLKNEQIFTEPFDMIFDEALPNVVSTMLIERKLLYRASCFDERFSRGEDNLLVFRLAFQTSFGFIRKPCVIIDRTPKIERLTRDSLHSDECLKRYLSSILILFEAYYFCHNRPKYVVQKLRYLLRDYLSRAAVLHCLGKNAFDARRFALEGMHFGSGWRAFGRCIAVLFCPWLVRRILRSTKRKKQVPF